MKKTAFALLAPLAAAFSLAACGNPTQHIGQSADDPALRGTTTASQIFTGGPANSPHTTIDGSALQADGRYRVDGSLTVEGDVPAGVRIDVNDGKLTITGDLGAESRIDVQLPVISHNETITSIVPIMTSCGQNCMTTIMVPQTSIITVIDGLRYPADTGPAVTIGGRVGADVSIITNGSVTAGGWSDTARLRAGHGAERADVRLQQRPGA